MPHEWDPARYLGYADERGRPFLELLARVRAEQPREVVDLGCGPGNLTTLLARRWPDAHVVGLDSSEAMVAAAPADARVELRVADLREWRPAEPVDVLVSNATLQWVPGHLELLPRLVGGVRPGGWFAFQVPGNFAEPSHVLRHELSAEAPYADHLAGVAEPDAHDAATYAEALLGTGLVTEVDAWETTYLHQLTGEDAVHDWILGTSLRPTLQALPEDLRASYDEELRRRLRAAYPVRHDRVALPFRRVFVVAQVTDR